MIRNILSTLVIVWGSLEASLEVLPSRYLVSYGRDDAPYQVVEFMTLSCPHCVDSFSSEFQSIRHELIDSGKVQWVFHPLPNEEVTCLAFAAMKEMSSLQKRIFLELLMEAGTKNSYQELLSLVKGFMEEKEFSKEEIDDQAFFTFLSKSEIDQSPILAINGVVRPDLLPTLEDIRREVMCHER